jgi:hypothetical protein
VGITGIIGMVCSPEAPVKPSIAILDAMSDQNLFGRWFRGPSWDAWRTLLAALFGLPMTPEMTETFKSFTGRTATTEKPYREVWLCCGRRAGKSLIAALLAVYIALFRDYENNLAPGELATVMVVAADRKQARVILRYVRAFVNEIPMLREMVTRELRESLEFSNRTVIEIHSASFRTIRGYSCAACINDEIAFWLADENSAEPAGEIISAQRPALATLPGSLLISLSSPHARKGPMYEAFRDHYGKDDSPVLFWRAPSLVMNPSLDRRVVDEAFARDPVAAAAEYDANFRSDVASFISREVVEALAHGRAEHPAGSNIRYFAFVDPSGGSSDSMTLAIAHPVVLRNGPGAALDLVREVRPPFSPDAVVRDFANVLRSYKIREVVGDAYAGEWPRERFRAAGIEYRTSPLSRSEIYLEFLPLLNAERTRLLDNPRLVAQIAALERHVSRSGTETVDHPPGGHDDLANSAAGAIVLAAKQPEDSGAPFLCTTNYSTGVTRIIR